MTFYPMAWLLVAIVLWPGEPPQITFAPMPSRKACHDAMAKDAVAVIDAVERTGRGVAFCVRGDHWVKRREGR